MHTNTAHFAIRFLTRLRTGPAVTGILAAVLLLSAPSAQAGWFDDLFGGGDPSAEEAGGEDTGAKDTGPKESAETTGDSGAGEIPDPNKGPVRVDITVTSFDGRTHTERDYCDFRKRENRSCRFLVVSGGKGEVVPAADGENIGIRLTMKRWPHAEDMVYLNYHSRRPEATHDAQSEASLADLARGEGRLRIRFDDYGLYGGGSKALRERFDDGDAVAEVTFKLSPYDL